MAHKIDDTCDHGASVVDCARCRGRLQVVPGMGEAWSRLIKTKETQNGPIYKR